MQVYVQDFGDNYHRMANEPTSELEAKARNIKRRYKDLDDFYNAEYVYYTYMNQLYEKYNGKNYFNMKLDANLIKDFIPNKPRLKANRLNKSLYKMGIIPGGKPVITPEYIDEFCRQHDEWRAQQPPLTEEEIEAMYNPSKKEKKMVKKMYEKMEMKRNPYNYKLSEGFDIDMMNDYFGTVNSSGTPKELRKLKKNGKYGKARKRKKVRITIQDYIDGTYENKIQQFDPLLGQGYSSNLMMTGGQFITAKTQENLEMYDTLIRLGWSREQAIRMTNVDKKVARGYEKDMNKKVKKSKKKQKKVEKMMIDVFVDNDVYDDFDDYVRDMEDFTWDNISKGMHY
jgi:hypothetical protein